MKSIVLLQLALHTALNVRREWQWCELKPDHSLHFNLDWI